MLVAALSPPSPPPVSVGNLFLFLFDSTGFLPLQELHNTCKRFNVPAKHDMLHALLEKVERNDRNEANYEQFLKLLNWRDCPGKRLGRFIWAVEEGEFSRVGKEGNCYNAESQGCCIGSNTLQPIE